jgi:hypothetical protein
MFKRLYLRTMLLMVACVAGLLAALRLFFTVSPAFSILADGGRYVAYVDEARLGMTPVTVSRAEASELGLGPIRANQNCRQTPFGVFLTAYPRPDGSLPLVYLHNTDGAAGGKKLLTDRLRNGSHVLLRLSLVDDDGRISLVPRTTKIEIEGQQVIGQPQLLPDRIVFPLRIPAIIQRRAVSNHGGASISVHVYSLKDGSSQTRLFHFRELADFESKTVTVERLRWMQTDDLAFQVILEGVDDEPLKGLEDLENGVILVPDQE